MIFSKFFIAFGCIFVVGCGPTEEVTLSPQKESSAESSSVSNTATNSNTTTSGPDVEPNVEPGTELTEADFKQALRQALRETGAKYVVLQVYMEACGPCMSEALHLTKQQEAWKKSGVAILGMGMDETPAGPQAFYRHTGGRITFPLYLAPWFSEQQEVFATPTLFIYGADGEQLFRADSETSEEGVMVALNAKLSQLVGEQGEHVFIAPAIPFP